MDKNPFSLPVPETVSKMQIKCRPLEWQEILVCAPPAAHYYFYYCAFFLLGCNRKQKVCAGLRRADCAGFGTLTAAGNMNPDILANFLNWRKKPTVCLGKYP